MLEKLVGYCVNCVDVVIGGIIFEVYLEGTGTHDHCQLGGFGTRLGRINNDHPKESPDHVEDSVRKSLIHVQTKLCRVKLVDSAASLRNRLECRIWHFP